MFIVTGVFSWFGVIGFSVLLYIEVLQNIVDSISWLGYPSPRWRESVGVVLFLEEMYPPSAPRMVEYSWPSNPS